MVALGVFFGVVATNADEDPGNLWMIPTVPLWIWVFTGHLWRRTRPVADGMEVLVLRRRVRLVIWRSALVLVFVAFALLWVASFWHWRASIADYAWDYSTPDADAGHYAFFAALWWWPLAPAALLILVQPLLFPLAPAPVRDAVRRAKAMKAAVGAERFTRSGHTGFDPGRGAAGRPIAVAETRSRERTGGCEPVRPDRGHATAVGSGPDAAKLSPAQAKVLGGWWQNGSLRWDGTALIATDATGTETRLPVADLGPDRIEPRESRRRAVAEVVWYEEWHQGNTTALSLRRKLWCNGVLFLDRDGFRIAQMPGVGLTAELAGRVAQAAGLPFAAYDLGGSPQTSPFRPSASIFPRRRRAITVKAR
ncbi:MAG TPA: hypothetical protein VGX23_16185 [Actinocrinis sp.]|nr:hypothetical protein [Actinocrinis sp.]